MRIDQTFGQNKHIKINSSYYAEVCNELVEPISATWYKGNTAICRYFEAVASRL